MFKHKMKPIFEKVVTDCNQGEDAYLTSIKEVIEETKSEDVKDIYILALSMIGISQKYAVMLVYVMIKKGLITADFVGNELSNHFDEVPEHIQILLENYDILTPEICVQALQKTTYGSSVVTKVDPGNPSSFFNFCVEAGSHQEAWTRNLASELECI